MIGADGRGGAAGGGEHGRGTVSEHAPIATISRGPAFLPFERCLWDLSPVEPISERDRPGAVRRDARRVDGRGGTSGDAREQRGKRAVYIVLERRAAAATTAVAVVVSEHGYAAAAARARRITNTARTPREQFYASSCGEPRQRDDRRCRLVRVRFTREGKRCESEKKSCGADRTSPDHTYTRARTHTHAHGQNARGVRTRTCVGVRVCVTDTAQSPCEYLNKMSAWKLHRDPWRRRRRRRPRVVGGRERTSISSDSRTRTQRTFRMDETLRIVTPTTTTLDERDGPLRTI